MAVQLFRYLWHVRLFKKALSSWLERRKPYLGNDEDLVWRLASYMSDGRDLNTYSDYENAAKNLTLDQVNAALIKLYFA